MSVDTTLAVLYAQSGLSTNVANAAMVAPQASLAMTRVLAAEEARQQEKKVAKLDKTDSVLVSDRNGRREAFFAKRKKMAKPPLSTTPFLGNLLNYKV